MSNQQLAEEIQVTIIKTFEKCNLHSSFIGNIRDADVADMQLKSTFN